MGAKVFGKLVLEDNLIVAANAVVTKDILTNATVMGIPVKAKI